MLSAGPLTLLDNAIFHALNGLVGRSWAVDSLIALALDNVLVKAGPIGACFFYAWYREGGQPQALRRRILLVTLFALLLIAPLTKALSDSRLAPRPFLLGEQSYVLQDGELAPLPRSEFHTLQTGEMKARVDNLRQGQVDANDLATFPSDHAAFFIALSLGILLACRRAGWIALAWTLLVTLASRVAAGMHSPLDVAAGGLIGAAILVLLQLGFAGRRSRFLEPVIAWTSRHSGLTAALLFLMLFEAANTMQTLKRVLELASAIAGRLL
jgi:membrane-associated phospholipid phosphatase